MSSGPRVTIAGAGVFGLASALALADAGCAVTVCDPGGANASSVAAGMIAPVFEAVLDETARPHLDLLLRARDLWPSLAARAGIALDRTGAMAVGDDAWLDDLEARFGALYLRPAEIGGATAREMAPGLSGGFDRALLTREDWRVDAPAALAGLAGAAREAGVAFERRTVAARGDADVLLLATGADADLAALAPELTQLSPIKGHILRLGAPAVGAVVRGERIYVAPGEAAVFGATMEPGVADATIDPAKGEALRAAGLQLFPGLAGAPVTVEAGVRAATPDGLPLVGPSSGAGVVLATGARRNGWLLAPLVAQVAAAMVMGRNAGPYAGRFDPGRFQGGIV
ncbi:MAG: D-amino-acid oxidase [Phenylobacterium zucineum]|nr:MAG: D-amino-acid oxidase [Phenylobacterium zucineum]